jgi:hypothetical protein
MPTEDGEGRYVRFQYGIISWTVETGAQEVLGDAPRRPFPIAPPPLLQPTSLDGLAAIAGLCPRLRAKSAGGDFSAQRANLKRGSDTTWTFELAGIPANTTTVIWQVALVDYGLDVSRWTLPPGLIASGRVPGPITPGKSVRFEIDFAAFTPPLADGSPPPPPDENARNRAGRVVSSKGSTTIRPAELPPITPQGRKRFPPGSLSGQMIAAPSFGGLINPWRYSVRVIALDVAGATVGLPSNSLPVVLETDTVIEFPFPAEDEKLKPEARILSYSPPRPDRGSYKNWIATRDVVLNGRTVARQGEKVAWDESHLDSRAWNVVMKALDKQPGGFGQPVNWSSSDYGLVRDTAIERTADALPDCDTTCQAFLRTALDVVLAAALNLPLELPSFDYFAQMGQTYLVETITALAERQNLAKALSREVVERGVDELLKAASEIAEQGPQGERLWKPDPDYLPRPAIVQVEITNGSKDQPLSGLLTVTMPGIFKMAAVPVPGIAARRRAVVPVFMVRDVEAWRSRWSEVPVDDAALEAAWQDAFAHAESTLTATFTTGGEFSTEVVEGVVAAQPYVAT